MTSTIQTCVRRLLESPYFSIRPFVLFFPNQINNENSEQSNMAGGEGASRRLAGFSCTNSRNGRVLDWSKWPLWLVLGSETGEPSPGIPRRKGLNWTSKPMTPWDRGINKQGSSLWALRKGWRRKNLRTSIGPEACCSDKLMFHEIIRINSFAYRNKWIKNSTIRSNKYIYIDR